MSPLFEINLDLPPKGSRGTARFLYQQLKAAIVDGRLAEGSRLPATRYASVVFGVSRNTAVSVYERLLTDGYVVARQGSGTRVADVRMAKTDRPSRLRAHTHDARLNPFWLRADTKASLDFWRSETEDRRVQSAEQAVDFRPALVDARLFPHDVFRKVSLQQSRRLEREPAAHKSFRGNQGNHELRFAIAQHIAVTRAVICAPVDVLVTSGAQQAFDILARTLVRSPGAVVAIEDPGYPSMRVAFAAAGARLVPIPVDGEGMIVEQIPPETQIICVCPSHQFPLGVSMSAARRRDLIAFARRHGSVIVEDDYDGEFRYEGSPLEALRTADDVVFYVGTFSKCMLPSLRLGFIIAPDWAMQTLVAAKNGLDRHSSAPLQYAVAAFVSGGHLTRHVRKMRAIYRRRRELLLRAFENELGQWLCPVPSFYGMHVCAVPSASVDLEHVAEELLKRNVRIHTLDRYFLGPVTTAGLILAYGVVDFSEIERGLSMLRTVLQDQARR